MLTIPVSLCIYSAISITTYPIKTEVKIEEIYPQIKNAYLAGIKNADEKIIAACIFLSSIEDSKDENILEITKQIFENHQETNGLIEVAKSLPISKLNINLNNGTLEKAFSDRELEMLYMDFYVRNSTLGRA